MPSYKDFIELVNNRYSCRKYADRKVEKETLLQVLEAARLDPSACNKQPWRFYVVSAEPLRQRICECYDREWVKSAPAFIVAVGNHDEAWHRSFDNKDHTDVDLSIATEHICLAATSLGLGTCWICHFNPELCKEVLNLDANQEPIAIIPIGYPENENIPEKKRKSIDEIVEWCDL